LLRAEIQNDSNTKEVLYYSFHIHKFLGLAEQMSSRC